MTGLYTTGRMKPRSPPGCRRCRGAGASRSPARARGSTEAVCGRGPMADPSGRGTLSAMSKWFRGESAMSNIARNGGIAASIVLIALGIGAIVVGFVGRDTVRSDLAREQIVGTPDSAIPGQKVDTGSEAKDFAAVMRKHTLEATGGQTYSQMGRFLDENGKPTSDEKAAAIDPKTGKPVENGLRNMWVTSTALTTALNTAYFAESVATFAIVMGFALLLTGIGFLVLTVRILASSTAGAKTARNASAVPTTS